MNARAVTKRELDDGAAISRYLRSVDPIVDVIDRSDAEVRLTIDYGDALSDIGHWLVAWWCAYVDRPEWAAELLDEDGDPVYDADIDGLADWFERKRSPFAK